MATTGKTRVRRQQIRRHRAERIGSWWQRVQARVTVWSALTAVVFLLAAVAVALYGQRSLGYQLGQTVDQAITARVDFTWVNDAKTEENRQEARAATPSVYKVNRKLIDDIGLALQQLYQSAKAETFEDFAKAAAQAGWSVDQELFADLKKRMSDEDSKWFAQRVEFLQQELQKRFTYRLGDQQERQPRPTGLKVRIYGVGEPAGAAVAAGETPPLELAGSELVPISSHTMIEDMASAVVRRVGVPPSPLQDAIRNMLIKRFSAEPLLVYDAARTEQAMQKAAEAVEPAVVAFKRGQPIVSPDQGGGEVVLERNHLALLQAEDAQYRALLASDDPVAAPLRKQRYLAQAGTVVILLLLSLGLFMYVGQTQPRILEVRTRTVAFFLLVLALLLATRLINLRLGHQELILVPAVIAAACLTIAYPRQFAMVAMGLVALMVVQTVRGDFGLLITLLVGLCMTVYLLNDIRLRTQIITAGLWTAMLVAVVVFALSLVGHQALRYAAQRAVLSAASTVGAALVVQAILPFIERAFRIATSLTLLEWSSADKPLLQRLAREAPGTYNHSLVLGTMAEAACETIGVNGLLVRVGALYHDIGKIHKSDYFAENQEAKISRHTNLAASMSLLIILGHVKDGLELAREYGLPRVLYQFIEEHHGTTVVKYFHHKASEKQPQIASGKHDRSVSEAEFRYPGPRPRSKESAILMLCDGVEGAVRALSEPTAGRIEATVHQIVMDRLNDGQFSDCDITLRELRRVEESLVKSLCTFYHGRVAYPKSQPAKAESEDQAQQRQLA